MKNSINNVLFLCLGNICRSPTAESIFRKKSEEKGLSLQFDSAGTSANHIGEKSDPRSIKFAETKGYKMNHLARQIQAKDFSKFDLILTMDDSNYEKVIGLVSEKEKLKIHRITDYCEIKKFKNVPDPYYGTQKDFELVIEILENAAENFFNKKLF